jgi:SMODS-associating 2TM, beta-strand rich effector domain
VEFDMHAYATDVDRKTTQILLAVIAIGVTFAFISAIQALKIQIPWWVDAPSVMGFYGIFYALFDQVLWRLHLGPLPLSRIPDVRGVWAGVLTSSYKDSTNKDGTKIDIVFYIHQTWTKISIRTETATSTSSTVMAALNTDESPHPGLMYEYFSEPGAFAKETMHTHRGAGHLRLSSDGKTLIGDYYTGRDRVTLGTLELHLVSKDDVNREEALKLLAPERVSSGS